MCCKLHIEISYASFIFKIQTFTKIHVLIFTKKELLVISLHEQIKHSINKCYQYLTLPIFTTFAQSVFESYTHPELLK